MKPEPFAKFMRIVRSLEVAQIHFRVDYHRYDAITVEAVVPGERWEIDILDDGTVDFERFVTTGGVVGEDEMKTAIEKWAEPAPVEEN